MKVSEEKKPETKDKGKISKTSKKSKVKEWGELVKSSRKTMTEECMCSICREIIVKATVCNPCGHMFCFHCIWSRKMIKRECPNCRTKIFNTTKCLGVDNIVSGMVMKGEFRAEDLVTYLKRSNKLVKLQQVSLMTCTIIVIYD